MHVKFQQNYEYHKKFENINVMKFYSVYFCQKFNSAFLYAHNNLYTNFTIFFYYDLL